MSKHGKILVAMSGGIDSTVAAMMLHEEGYEVIGVTMKTWDYANSSATKKETGCCSLDSINDARAIAVNNGFHHFIVDIREEFGNYVIDNFIDEYMAGRTPNPCVLCNTHIKWESLLRRADALDCEHIATGHYAIIKQVNDRYFVSKGVDEQKDQTYVLWGLSQECLSRTKLPLGIYTKPEIRKMAFDWGYEELSKKAESFEICFIPDNDYRNFLRHNVEGIDKLAGGDFVDINNNVIGKHKGYPFYTIGQRKGLGQEFGQPMYVAEIDAVTNKVVLGEAKDILRNGMKVTKLNLQKYETIVPNFEAAVQVRYNDRVGTMATLNIVEDALDIVFSANVRGIAPGQSAVIYEGDDVVGGGIIHSSLKF